RVNPSARNLRPQAADQLRIALWFGTRTRERRHRELHTRAGWSPLDPDPCANVAAPFAFSLKREEFRMRSTPLIMTGAVLIEHHSETNAGALITAFTKLVQPLALT